MTIFHLENTLKCRQWVRLVCQVSSWSAKELPCSTSLIGLKPTIAALKPMVLNIVKFCVLVTLSFDVRNRKVRILTHLLRTKPRAGGSFASHRIAKKLTNQVKTVQSK